MLNAVDLLSIASVLVGIAGLVFAYIEHRGRVKAEQMLKNELTAILNRVRVLVPYGKSISSMLEGIDNPKLNRWVWVKYKGLSDLYVLIVTHYLAAQKEFRYTDLKRLVDNHTISTKWEERIWRDLISLREENIKAVAPDFYLKDNSNRINAV